MIQTELFIALLTSSDLVDLIGTRVYPMRLSQGAQLPAIVYQLVGLTPITSIDGDSNLDSARMQLTCWADSYAEAADVNLVARSAINQSNIKSTTQLSIDQEDRDKKTYGVITDYEMWTTFSSTACRILAEFERVTFEGDDIITEIDLPSAISADGFYLVSKNGRIATETEEYTINAERNKITFTDVLAGGSFKDEGLIIYQNDPTPTFGRVEFEGNDIITEIDLPSAIVDDGLYFVTLNGRVAKEGAAFTYTINEDRDKIIFNDPLAGGDFKDEGVIIYQSA